MSELLLVANPRRRRRKNPHRRHRARRSNPHRRHRARRSNPHRRHHRRRHNPVMRRHHRRRRNPDFSMTSIQGFAMPVLKEGFVGAGGALLLDAVWGYVNPQLPATISSSPYLQFAVKCLAAIGVGMVGGKVLKGKGRDLAVGGVTVAAHNMLQSVLQSSLPTVFGAGGTLALSGYSGLSAYLSGSAPIVGTASFPRTYQMKNPGLGAYLSGSSGTNDGAGVYTDDCMGFDPWDGTS
jgi:hypothetical protein